MRLDHRRDRVVALLFVALLASPGMPEPASAQVIGGQRGAQDGGASTAPEQVSPAPGQPAQPGQPGQPGESPPGRPSPVNLDAVPADTSPLARYIPAEATGVFFEFPGLNMAPDAWKGSSAYGMLNETSLGAMLRELIAQLVEVAPGAPAGTMTGPEVVAIAEHLARHGFVVASPQDSDRQSHYRVVVLRNAAHREVRGLFGKLIGTIAPEGAKPQVVAKGGGRQVVVMGSQGVGDWAWWIEGNDLVLVFNDSNAADRVIAAIDGQETNAVEDEVRKQLMVDEGTFRPLAFGTWRFDRPGANPTERSFVEANGLKRADLRWGFDGKESLTVVRLDAPAPRQGFMTIFDQPALPLGELPPIPPDVASLSVFSIDPDGLYDAIVSLAGQGNPALVQPIRGFEEAVTQRARIDFKGDILASMGPKVAIYTMPKPAPRPSGGNPISGMVNALGGLNLPQFVVAIQVDDASSFTQKLDGMILAINQQIASAIETTQPQPDSPPAREGSDQRGDERPAPRPEPPKFSMTLATPRTYLLKLPDGLYGLTGYQPTITMGKQYMIIASSPILARQCRELEAAEPAERWAPPGDLAGRLPAELTMLVVNDPSQSFPTTIAALPSALNLAMNPPTPAPASNTPGASPAAANSSGPGFDSGFSGEGSGVSGGNPGDLGVDVPLDEGSSAGYSGSGDSSGNPSAPSGGAQGAGSGTIQLPASLIPSSDELRQFLFPAVYAVSVDEAGVRLEARETLPGQWGLSGMGNSTAIPLPIPGTTGLGLGGVE